MCSKKPCNTPARRAQQSVPQAISQLCSDQRCSGSWAKQRKCLRNDSCGSRQALHAILVGRTGMMHACIHPSMLSFIHMHGTESETKHSRLVFGARSWGYPRSKSCHLCFIHDKNVFGIPDLPKGYEFHLQRSVFTLPASVYCGD